MKITTWIYRLNAQFHHACLVIPASFISLMGRFGIAAIFWQSGQTKITGLQLNIIDWQWLWGWPKLADSTIPLFTDEYHLPLLSPTLGAYLATFNEHVFSVLILLGLATRFSSFVLLLMTLTIEIFVFPGAYATHAVWGAVLLYLMKNGAGQLSLDHVIKHWCDRRCR